MFTILTPDQFVTSPWKNGGGVTHEIARKEANGKWVWRVSIAEVAADGPFSHFEKMSRILTVIEGSGIDLQSPNAILNATLLKPVSFSGDLPINGRLTGGPIRDLNVIYDASLIDARVTALSGPTAIKVGESLAGYLSLSGTTIIDDTIVPLGAFALGKFATLNLEQNTSGILVSLPSCL